MRERFLQMRDSQGGGRWAERRMIFELGFPYLGPLNARAWGFAQCAMSIPVLTGVPLSGEYLVS